MARRLTKPESRRRWTEMREMWRRFDPIGVFVLDTPSPPDEYDDSVDAGPAEVPGDLRRTGALLEETQAPMGLGPAPAAHYLAFAEQLLEWYQSHWLDTVG